MTSPHTRQIPACVPKAQERCVCFKGSRRPREPWGFKARLSQVQQPKGRLEHPGGGARCASCEGTCAGGRGLSLHTGRSESTGLLMVTPSPCLGCSNLDVNQLVLQGLSRRGLLVSVEPMMDAILFRRLGHALPASGPQPQLAHGTEGSGMRRWLQDKLGHLRQGLLIVTARRTWVYVVFPKGL